MKLSYVFTTYNKLDFLKVALPKLVANKGADEEIVVTDGGSTDGSCEYLTEAKRCGDIDQFLSEPDKGEAHGYNRALLLAKGDLIKFVTDDDVYDWSHVRRCRAFMERQSEVDVIATDGLQIWREADGSIGESVLRLADAYLCSVNGGDAFKVPGVGLMLRRESLALLGLLSCRHVAVDTEFGMRIQTGQAIFGWYTGVSWARVLNVRSNGFTQEERIRNEKRQLDQYYGVGPWSLGLPGQWKWITRETAVFLKNRFTGQEAGNGRRDDMAFDAKEQGQGGYAYAFESLESRLSEMSNDMPGEFLLGSERFK